jgi:GNAT superfamily N-acetyltransferase
MDVQFRPCRGAADYAALADVANIVSADEFGLVSTAETFARRFEQEVAGYDVAASVLVAEAEGRVVGYAYGYWEGDRDDIGRVLWIACRVHPAWQGRGIEATLLAAAHAGAIRHGAAQPPTHLPSVFRTLVAETATAMVEVLAAHGYRPVEWMHLMVRPTLDDPPDDTLPAGIEARPVRPEDGLTVLRALEEAMQDERGWIPTPDAAMTAILSDPIWGQIETWQVAWAGDEVVGGVLGWIDPEPNPQSGRRRGATERIFTRRPWRGRGIARALMGRNLRELARRGMDEAALAVDTANPSGALRLYEGVGFRPTRTITIVQRPVEV